ncbi:MAG: 3D domain-containing protein [Polyangiaceae bacterium]
MRLALALRATSRHDSWRVRVLLPLLLVVSGCATGGNAWLRQASTPEVGTWEESSPPRLPTGASANGSPRHLTSVTLGSPRRTGDPTASIRAENGPPQLVSASGSKSRKRGNTARALEGKVLGTFRNTYYDFPAESDFSGETVPLHNAQCKPLGQVPKDFFEVLCVQGSGLLGSGTPVSFNRRDCECAQICTKTAQRICFDALDVAKYPWGRGAMGNAITPLLTVAVDSKVIPLGTAMYIPEYDGLPRDVGRTSFHDGCFIAQDRGLKVQGQHVDVFTGQRTLTQLWNGLVPSNSGVTVVLESPRCARAD